MTPAVCTSLANRVFRSTDEGESWDQITPTSPSTIRDARPARRSDHGDMTGTEWYASVFALNESPLTRRLLWAGSDDGLIHISRDRGATWTNVTPAAMAKFTRVSSSSRRTSMPATAYVAANRYQLDDFKPYLCKTTDFGRRGRRSPPAFPTARTCAPFARIPCAAACSTRERNRRLLLDRRRRALGATAAQSSRASVRDLKVQGTTSSRRRMAERSG